MRELQVKARKDYLPWMVFRCLYQPQWNVQKWQRVTQNMLTSKHRTIFPQVQKLIYTFREYSCLQRMITVLDKSLQSSAASAHLLAPFILVVVYHSHCAVEWLLLSDSSQALHGLALALIDFHTCRRLNQKYLQLKPSSTGGFRKRRKTCALQADLFLLKRVYWYNSQCFTLFHITVHNAFRSKALKTIEINMSLVTIH